MATALPHVLPADEPPLYYSAAMVDALNRVEQDAVYCYECVDGELLVTPDVPRPWHAALVDRLYRALVRYADDEPAAGYVSTQPIRITFGRPDVNVRPDVWAIHTAEWRAQDWEAVTVPLLLVEVLSPSTQRHDRFPKRRAYMDAGVPLYWVVDGERRHVEVWTPGASFPRFEREQLTWHPEGAAAPFAYALGALFAEL